MRPLRWELIILSCVWCAKLHNWVFFLLERQTYLYSPTLLLLACAPPQYSLACSAYHQSKAWNWQRRMNWWPPGMHISKSKVWRTEESLLRWQHSCTDEERSHMANFACRYIICRLKTMALAPTELIWLDSWMKEKASFQLHHWASWELAPPLASCNTVGASARCSQAATKQNRSKASRHQEPREK